MNSDMWLLILILLFCINMIITGIVGFIRKDINVENIVLKIFFIPLGIVGSIILFFTKKITRKDTGLQAQISSIAVVALGLFVLLADLMLYLLIFKNYAHEELTPWLAGGILFLSILIILAIRITENKYKEIKN